MDKTDGEIARKRTIGVLWLVFVCFFNTLPLFVISVLANLDGVSSCISNLVAVFLPICLLDSRMGAFPRRLGEQVTKLVLRGFWCASRDDLFPFWVLPSCYHALAHEGMLLQAEIAPT
jgi:hypothetical protein